MIRWFMIPMVLLVVFSFSGCKVSGKVTHNGAPLAGVTLAIEGEASAKTGADGTYVIKVNKEGTFVVIPRLHGFRFVPERRTAVVDEKEGEPDIDFEAIPVPVTHTVPGDYATIQAAVNAASPGNRVLVSDGEYGESLVISKPLILESVNGYGSTLIRASDGFDGAMVDIRADDVTVRGFSLRGKACTGFRIVSEGRLTDPVVYRRCILEGNLTDVEGSGIEAEGGNHQFLRNQCMNSTGSRDGTAGIFIVNPDRDAVTGNTCENNSTGIALLDERLPLSGDTGSKLFPSHATVADNLLKNNGVGGIVRGAYYQVSGNTFRKNGINIQMFGVRIAVSGNTFGPEGQPVTALSASGLRSEIFLNDYAGADFLFKTNEHDTRCFSKNVMYRFGGKMFVGVLGNFIGTHDLRDEDGNGLADTPLVITPFNTVPVLSQLNANYDTLFKGTGLSGHVLQDDGSPVEGVSVSLGGAAELTALTDSNGGYRFEGLESGVYRITAAREGYYFPAGPFYITLENDAAVSRPVECADLLAVVQQTVHVPGDYATIQEAVNGVNDGDIIQVAPGDYPEGVVIERPVALISDGGAGSTFIRAAEGAALRICADQVLVKGFSVENGILLGSAREPFLLPSSFSTIRENRTALISVSGGGENRIVENTGAGSDLKGLALALERSNNNMVSKNTISSQEHAGSVNHGMYLHFGDGNLISGNRFLENVYGMELDDSGDNYVFLNRFENSVQADFHLAGKVPGRPFQSPRKISYAYDGTLFATYMGNYYSGQDLADADGNGIGDAPFFIADHGGEIYYDHYPLTGPPEGYGL